LNKTGVGEKVAKWNTYVRRRKWKFAEASTGTSAKVAEIQSRHAARVGGSKPNSPNPTGSTQAEKIGYVSRQHVAAMKESGLSSAGMMGGKKNQQQDQDLDEESAAGLRQVQNEDVAIDQDVAEIGGALDRLNAMAVTMGEETKNQNKKLDKLDSAMQTAGEKQAIVNQRLKRQIKSNS